MALRFFRDGKFFFDSYTHTDLKSFNSQGRCSCENSISHLCNPLYLRINLLLFDDGGWLCADRHLFLHGVLRDLASH